MTRMQSRSAVAFCVLLAAFAGTTTALRLYGQSWARAVYWPVLRDRVTTDLQARRYHTAESDMLRALDASPQYADQLLELTAGSLGVLPRLAARLLRPHPHEAANSPAIDARVRYAMADFAGLARTPLLPDASPAVAVIHGLAVRRLGWWDDPRARFPTVTEPSLFGALPPEVRREFAPFLQGADTPERLLALGCVDEAREAGRRNRVRSEQALISRDTVDGQVAMLFGQPRLAAESFADAVEQSDAALDAALGLLRITAASPAR